MRTFARFARFARFAPAITLTLLAAPLAVPLSAQTPSFEDVLSLRTVGAPAISPDGKHAAFTIRTTEWSENRYDTEIWLSRDGGAPTQLTRTAKGSSTSPRWSPDGAW